MYSYYDDLFSRLASATTTKTAAASDFLPYEPEAPIPTPPIYLTSISPTLPPPILAPTTTSTATEFDSVHTLPALKSEVGYYSTSSSYGSPISLPSHYLYDYQQEPSQHLVQTSMSSHHPFYECLEESSGQRGILLDDLSESGSMRKVYSSGDIEIINSRFGQSGLSESPSSHENCTTGEISRVGRYTAEERKQRIERYKSKKNQRNFTKKIKYVCRKTLADSRARIRGRFARNEEMCEIGSSQAQWNMEMGVDEESISDVWINLYEAFSSNKLVSVDEGFN